jgi:hypothetical protein
MGWGGKSGIVAPVRASGQSPPHGGGYFRFGNERAMPLVFLLESRTEAVSLPRPQGGKNGTLAGRDGDGRPTRRLPPKRMSQGVGSFGYPSANVERQRF